MINKIINKFISVGTRSILFGVHCWFIHPLFVAIAWIELYGWPEDFRIWISFMLHDIGYLGKPNMDGTEGQTHPELGAEIMHRLFDKRIRIGRLFGTHYYIYGETTWKDFILFHSRFYAKKHNAQPSKLCFADKLAISTTPWWIYLPLARLSTELAEYKHGGPGRFNAEHLSDREWLKGIQKFTQEWVEKHKDGSDDTWTPGGNNGK